jgi:hypothetical protein
VLTPDYIVPNGFFAVEGGVINFAGVDIWEYQALPADPTQSYNRDNVLGTNSPRNFAGQTTVLTGLLAPPPPPPPPPVAEALNFQAMWWRSPAGSESGWGVNITHQGDILFATWFTYDADGSGMWLVAPETRKTTANRFTGALYARRGLRSVPFRSLRRRWCHTRRHRDLHVHRCRQRDLRVLGGHGHAIEADHAPGLCLASFGLCGRNDGRYAQSYQDMWWRARPEANRVGRELNHQGDILFATWFTYEAAGKGLWLVIPEARLTTPGTYTGAIYTTTGPALQRGDLEQGPGQGDGDRHGDLHVHGWQLGTFAYTVGSVSQSKAIVRQAYSTPLTVCH